MLNKVKSKKILASIMVFCIIFSLFSGVMLMAEDTAKTLVVDGVGGVDNRYGTIDQALDAAANGDIIQLAIDITMDSTSMFTTRVDKSITIVGNGHTFNGEFNIVAPSITVNFVNLTINSTQVGEGGVTACLYVGVEGVTANFTNCTLTANGQYSSGIRSGGINNTINISGGSIESGFGIYARGNGLNINITNGAVLKGINANNWGGTGVLADAMTISPITYGSVTASDSTIIGTYYSIRVPKECVVTTINCTLVPSAPPSGGGTQPAPTSVTTGDELVAKLGGTSIAQSTYSSQTNTYTVTLIENVILPFNTINLNIPNIIIDGVEHVISTSSTNYPGIIVGSGKLTLKNMTLNMEVAVTGAGAQLETDNITVNSSVLSVGGVTAGIYVNGNNAIVTARNSSFTATGALSTGIRVDGSGVRVTADNCEITGAFGIYVNNTWSLDNPGNAYINVTGNTVIKSYLQTRSAESNISWGGQGIRVDGQHAVINFESGTITGIENPTVGISKSLFGIYVQGTDATVNISGGTINGVLGTITNEFGETHPFGGSAVLFEGTKAKCNITGGTLRGVTGIDIRGGGPVINVSGTADIMGISQIDSILGLWGGSGINVWDGNNTQANIAGGNISGDYGIYIQGNHSTFNVSGGAIIGTQKTTEGITKGGYGIYIFGANTNSNISGGNISGTNAGVLIESRNGLTNVIGMGGILKGQSALLAMVGSLENFIALDTVTLPSSTTSISGSPEMNVLGACFGQTDGVLLLGEEQIPIYKSDIPIPSATVSNGKLMISNIGNEYTIRYCIGNAFDLSSSLVYTAPEVMDGNSVISVAVTKNMGGYNVSNIAVIQPQIGVSCDVNFDGAVDMDDLVIMALSYGSAAQGTNANWDIRADLNNDGKVDLLDLSFLASYYR